MTDDEIDTEARALLEQMRTPKRRVRPRLAEPLHDAEDRVVETPVGRVTAWRLGAGPAVLLVHGWEDDNALWTPLIDALQALGRPVVALDLPGHGFSEAEMAGPESVAEAVLAVAAAMGPVDAVVGHSFGCPVSVRAMALGMRIDRAVLIASANPRRRSWFGRMRDRGVPEAIIDRVGDLMGEVYDVTLDIPGMTAAALFVHSLDDDQTPVEGAEELAALWPGAQLALSDGLGHRIIAQDPATLMRVVDWVA